MNVIHGIIAVSMALTIVASDGLARPITGSAVVHLTSPVTPAVREKAYAVASGYFKTDCVEWMKEESGIAVDTVNSLWRFHLGTFTENCLKLAKQETSFFKREWTITLTLTSEQADAALKEHNARCHRVSLSTWTNLKKLIEKDASGDVFRLGIQSIFFSMGRMEKELDVPGLEEPGSFLVDDARRIMQEYIDKISVRPAEYILKGKAGTILADPIVLKTLRDTTPIANFDLIGTVSQGKKVFFGKTGPDGVLTIRNFKIPYVAKGALLYIVPDFGAAVNNVCSFSASDMGIKFPEQTLLFNIEPATFALKYSATAVSDLAVPKDFQQDAFLRKFLCDSCFLKPAPSADYADLLFTVTTQVSCYSSDSTEMTTFKVENAVTIKDQAKKTSVEKTAVVHERAYETNTPFPLGLFFWEAAKNSSHMVKEVLGDL